MKSLSKKLLSVILVLCVFGSMMAVFAGCNKDKGKYEIGIFMYKYDDNYLTTVRNALSSKFEESKDTIKVTFYNGENVQATQTAQIDAAITAGVDLLIINAVDQNSAGDNLAKKCKDAGKPAIFFNREVPDSSVKMSDKFCFVGTDANAPGYMLGEMISDMLSTNDKYNKCDLNKDGKISYVMIRADVGNPEADGRTKYSVDEAKRLIAANANITAENKGLVQIGADENAGWDTTIAQNKMATFLSSNPMTGNNPIELVICNNDGMAMGAIAALNAAGYNLSGSKTSTNGKYVPVFGVDAIADAVAAITDGKMEGTVKQDGEAMATAIMKIAMNIKDGKVFIEGTEYEFDEGVNKIRIPYSKFLG